MSDALKIIIFVIDLILEGRDLESAYQRVANGIAANAEAEGRDVTPDESELIDGLLDASAQRRKGQS